MRLHRLVICGISGAIALCAGGQISDAQVSGPVGIGVGTVTSSGQGEVRVVPDRAIVSIGVETHAATAKSAASQNASLQSAVIDTLRALGYSGRQVSTTGYQVAPEYNYNQSSQAPKVTGYRVDNTVRVELSKVSDVATVIDAALAKGANTISGVDFTVSNADSVRRIAMTQAVANARADAEVMARAAGGSLGMLISLESTEPAIRPMFAMPMAARMSAAVATPIEAGEQTVSATVTARWMFKSGGE